MIKCDDCGTELVQMIMSSFCRNDCDKKPFTVDVTFNTDGVDSFFFDPQVSGGRTSRVYETASIKIDPHNLTITPKKQMTINEFYYACKDAWMTTDLIMWDFPINKIDLCRFDMVNNYKLDESTHALDRQGYTLNK